MCLGPASLRTWPTRRRQGGQTTRSRCTASSSLALAMPVNSEGVVVDVVGRLRLCRRSSRLSNRWRGRLHSRREFMSPLVSAGGPNHSAPDSSG